MTKMKHTSVQNRHKKPDTHGGILPETNPNLRIFIQNQSSSVCLPLVSDSQRLIWVYSNQIDLKPSDAVELSKAFDKFPYLTQKETNALAKRCSLHPDQVKVWFMVQRICYGISWDYEDILAVGSKLKSNQGKREPQNRRKKRGKAGGRKKKTRKREVGVSGGKKVEEECKKEKSTNKGENELTKREIDLEQPMKKEKNEKVEKDKKNTRKKRKQVTETGKVGEKRMKQGDGAVERGQEEETKRQTLVQLTGTELERGLHAMSINSPNPVTDIGKLKALIEGIDNPTIDSKVFHPKPRCHLKTQAQVTMMRRAFLQCQYPDNEDYNQLSALIGLQRSLLVQWYGDTRYHIKRGKLRWLSREQHSRLLANIKYRQFLKSVMRTQPAKSDKRIEWEKALDESASCDETKSVDQPPEAQRSAPVF